mgnify:CR=1 FL=1
MRLTKHLIWLALLAAAPTIASAAGDRFSYTYVEGGWHQERRGSDSLNPFDTDGGYLRGSYGFGTAFNVFGGYAKGEDDQTWRLSVGTLTDRDEETTAEIGVGYHLTATEHLDFTAELAYFRIEQDIEFSVQGQPRSSYRSWSAEGGRVAVGLRGGNQRIEGWVKLGYFDGSRLTPYVLGTDSNDGMQGAVGGQLKFNSTWGLVGEIEATEGVERYAFGVRASF